MTANSWEYLRVTYAATLHGVTWSASFSFERPDGAREERDAVDVSWIRVLNELGAEGWELVSERTNESVIVGLSRGAHNVGTPISVDWTFKRPARPKLVG